MQQSVNPGEKLGYITPAVLLIASLIAYTTRDSWLPTVMTLSDDPVQLVYVVSQFLAVAIWLLVCWLTLATINALVWRGVVANRRGKATPTLLISLFNTVVVLITLIMVAVGVLGVSALTTGMIVAAAIALTLLFFRQSINELVAGLAINLDENLAINSTIEVPGFEMGVVEQVSWRSTRLRLADGSVIVVPNSQLAAASFRKLEDKPMQTASFELTLDFAIPVQRAIRVLESALKAADREYSLEGFTVCALTPGQFGVNYQMQVQFRDHELTDIRTAVTRRVMKHLYSTGISPALPKQNVFVGEVRTRAMSWSNPQERATLMAMFDIFESLTNNDLAVLAEQVIVHQYHASDTVISQGDEGESMFGIVEGFLEVSVETDGQPLVVATMEPGEIFGEMSLLADEARSASIRSLSDAVVVEVNRASFTALLSERPEFMETISRLIAERQLQNNQLLAEATEQEREDAVQSAADSLLLKIRGVFSRLVNNPPQSSDQ